MDKLTFVILSFEGPDTYARAGGLGSRVTELSEALAQVGHETHLFFIGDPELPGHESAAEGRLHLHRWCQWISRYHPMGVYEGEEGKLYDWERSLPAWLETNLLEPRIAAGGMVIVMAEEWQTAGSLLALRAIVDRRGWQRSVKLLWNANNTFSFHRIDWEALKHAASITTVSRYMKHLMWRYGVDARVIPNGISQEWLRPVERRTQQELAELFNGRLTLVKVARWDPDKRWNMAIDAVADLKRRGERPLLLARGGIGAHRLEVLETAQRQQLGVATVFWQGEETEAMTEALRAVVDSDIVNMQSHLSLEQRRALYHASDMVLANSGIEPFGLVGLEAMAAGGVALVGCTGEDYVTPSHDAISIQTSDPAEIVHHAIQLKHSPDLARQIRRAAKRTAQRYTWQQVIARVLLPCLKELGAPVTLAQRAEAAQEATPVVAHQREVNRSARVEASPSTLK